MSIADAQRIRDLVEEIKKQKQHKAALLRSSKERDAYNRHMLELLDQLELANGNIIDSIEEPLEEPIPSAKEELAVPLPSKKVYKSKAKRTKYLQDIGVSEEVVKRLGKPERITKLTEIDYTVYSTNFYGKIANNFFRPFSITITRNYPDFFNRLRKSLRMSDIKVLANTYLSIMILSSILFFILTFFTTLILTAIFIEAKVVAIMTSITLAVVLGVACFALFYLYPTVVIGSRNKLIKNDLPFAIIHMAAIAGSGAQPVSIFKLLLNSGDYKGLESEIKKIVNYVNLFGYDLSTALKTVAATTPSKRFKDLLSGIAATVESGGSLKSYLNSMAEDTMTSYKLERKKYVETLSTYSDIYTGILIAAPLLFIVTLAIINILGGAVAGVSVGTIAIFGTYVLIPFLNIAFILFLNIVQPE